jgi:hypothetical protein
MRYVAAALTTTLLAVLLLALPPAGLRAQSAADNLELSRLFEQDQAVRMGQDDPGSDEGRRARVLELLAAGAVATPQDRFHAAMILQHTGLRFCDGVLQSLSPENYLLAHHLFRSAYQAGLQEARYFVAASIDRFLSFTAGYQRFGTNRVFDPNTGQEMLVPIDRATTDAERAEYGVPSLAQLLARYPEQPRDQVDK